MKSSDNLSALIYLKEKVHKWKNIAVLLAVLSIFILFSMVTGDKLSGDVVGNSYIANVKVEGVIFEDDFRSKILNKLAKEKSVKAVIVNINSPGGGIVGSEILFNDLRKIAKNKPLVVIMNSLAASGGYMAAIASDYIIARNGTLTGSIGVLMEAPQVTGLADKIGIKINSYKSSPLKGSPSPFENPSKEVNQVIQESISDSFEYFASLVKERRKGKIAKNYQKIVFDGRVFTGRQALKAGLVDKIGGMEDALQYLKTKDVNIDLEVIKVELKEEEKDILDKFFSILPFANLTKNSLSSHSQMMAIMR